MTGNIVVTDEQQFIDRLADGDILLFDKLGAVHRLVQWADNRPVGHCGIWSGGHLYEATMLEEDGVKRSGVFPTSLRELLSRVIRDDRGTEVALVRSVTAMRHRDITEGGRRRIAEISAESSKAGAFAEREMVLLARYALRRSYAHDDNRLGEILSNFIKLCQFMAPRTKPKPSDPPRVFCSEFVYRSYQGAGLPIEIANPLYDSYRANQRSSYRLGGYPDDRDGGLRPRGMTPSSVPTVELSEASLMAEYDAWFETEVVGTPVSTSNAQGHGTNERGVVEWVFQRRPPEFQEMVTPGDYWTSASLEPVVSLYRPPGR